MRLGYIRVSTKEQNTDRQMDALERYQLDKIYIEKVSGKNTDREELQRMFAEMQAGDTIYVHDFSRLSRSLSDLLNIVNMLRDRGITLVSNKENVDSSTPTGKLMLTMIGAINEFERTNLLERQREGIEAAKVRGKHMGRPRNDIFNNSGRNLGVLLDFSAGRITAQQAADAIGCSRATFYRLAKEV